MRTNALEQGAFIEGELYLISSVEWPTTARGVRYVRCVLSDAHGHVNAICWSPPTHVPERGPVRIWGNVGTYRDEWQIKITLFDDVTIIGDDERRTLCAFSPVDDATMRVKHYLSQLITDPDLTHFIVSVLQSASEWRTHPAAMRIHHAYRGGLVEHMASMLGVVSRLQTHYEGTYGDAMPVIRWDLVACGVVLHDLCKVDELDADEWGTAEYTDAGKLVGHISMGAALVQQFGDGRLDEQTIAELQHLVVSHHGRQDFGSPVTPKTIEAHILHAVDVLDSRMGIFRRLASDRTGWHRVGGDEWFIPQRCDPAFRVDEDVVKAATPIAEGLDNDGDGGGLP